MRNESSTNCRRVPPAGAASFSCVAPAPPLTPAAKRTAVSGLGSACGGVAVRFDRRAGRVDTAVSEAARMWGANAMKVAERFVLR
ncbi:MAG: hypothetical protein V1790_14445 [Planctomycetota bacterium]